MTAKKRIVWSVDPFSNESGFFRHVRNVIEAFASNTGAEVEPVYVLTPPNLFLPSGIDVLALQPDKPKMSVAWNKLTKGAKHPSLFLPPTILQDDGLSLRSTTKALNEYASTVGASMIAVATHGRKGVMRAFMGSFAESLLHLATLPTLVVNPKSERGGKIKTILFPVDFPVDPQSSFDDVVAFAKSIKAKLVLFHKIDYVTEYTSHLIYGVPMYQEYLDHDSTIRQKELDTLRARAGAAGVATTVLLDEGTGYVVDRIFSVAKKTKADLIAMVAKAGPAEAAFLGSVTRQVVRGANCPVWVIRPPAKAKPKSSR